MSWHCCCLTNMCSFHSWLMATAILASLCCTFLVTSLNYSLSSPLCGVACSQTLVQLTPLLANSLCHGNSPLSRLSTTQPKPGMLRTLLHHMVTLSTQTHILVLPQAFTSITLCSWNLVTHLAKAHNTMLASLHLRWPLTLMNTHFLSFPYQPLLSLGSYKMPEIYLFMLLVLVGLMY
jgi:hypothetical protein